MKADCKSLGALCVDNVEKTGPVGREFVYVDIGSINRETKRIEDAKTLLASKAPSRAKQVLKTGDVLVSMTRPNLNAVAWVPPNWTEALAPRDFMFYAHKIPNQNFSSTQSKRTPLSKPCAKRCKARYIQQFGLVIFLPSAFLLFPWRSSTASSPKSKNNSHASTPG